MKKTLGLIALFLFCAVTAQVGVETSKAAFWQWSKTASSNGNSDPSINWVEGMPPSVVNDSARAMMARLVEQFTDTSGSIVTAGGPTAFTATTSQGFGNPPQDGQIIGVRFNVASTGSPTLAVDGGTAYPIMTTPTSAANLVAQVPYSLLFTAASNEWLVRGGGGGGGLPLGSVVPYTGTGAPGTGWVLADGECISNTTYVLYWNLLGNPGSGYCTAGNFPVIDLRGRVVAGLDNMAGSTTGGAGRLTASGTGCGTSMTVMGAVCANGLEGSAITLAQMPAHHHAAGISDPGHGHPLSTSPGSPGAFLTTGYNQGLDHALGGGMGFQSISIGTGYTGVLVNGGPNGNNNTYDAGSSQVRPTVPPTEGLNYIIKVL